jgi:RND family efflux transporter MFP subunit
MNKTKTLFIAQLFGLAALTACSGNSQETTAEADEVSKPLVRVETVTARDVPQKREFTATVEANISNNIAPQSPVRIKDIFVEVGDRVRKGQKLVQMDNNNLQQAKTQLDNLQVEFNRVDELYKIGGVSKSEWDSKKTALDVAKTSYNNLVENTQLISPIDGVVTARNYDKGDLYSSGTPVLTVEQITPVKLKINVSEGYFTQVKKGMPVDIKLDVYGDEVFEGKVSLVYPTIDSGTRTFPVEITINNQNQRVRPGMFARVTMDFGMQNHVVVPDLAVVKQQGAGDRYVYVLNNDGTVSYNKVELGQRLGDAYELLSGVDNNAQVVVAGQARLTNGAAVEVEQK